jgi:hypothetical protein
VLALRLPDKLWLLNRLESLLNRLWCAWADSDPDTPFSVRSGRLSGELWSRCVPPVEVCPTMRDSVGVDTHDHECGGA